MALLPAESAEALTNLWEEAEPQRGGARGHLRVFLRCGRTMGPLSLGLRVQGRIDRLKELNQFIREKDEEKWTRTEEERPMTAVPVAGQVE